MTAPQASVIITGAGGAGTIEVLRSLRATGRYRLITADASNWAGGYRFADRSYVVPFGADERFSDAFRDICERERPNFIIPLVDEEIQKVHALVPTLSYRPRIVGPAAAFCELALDKWKTYKALEAAQLPVATTWLASDAESATYPAIIKPRSGRGSRGLAFLDGPADLRSYLAAAGRPASHFVVQEHLTGTEYTTSVVVSLDGSCLAVVPKETTDKRGITHVGVTRVIPEIESLGRATQCKLCANGPFNIQLIMGADGVPKVIEINPRYSTTVALTLAAGLDEVDVVLRVALGEDPGPLRWEQDLLMVRYTTQVFLPEKDWRPMQFEHLGAGPK